MEPRHVRALDIPFSRFPPVALVNTVDAEDFALETLRFKAIWPELFAKVSDQFFTIGLQLPSQSSLAWVRSES